MKVNIPASTSRGPKCAENVGTQNIVTEAEVVSLYEFNKM